MRRVLPVLVVACGVAACGGDAAPPTMLDAPSLNVASGFWITTLHVLPAEGSDAAMFGPLQIAFGTRLPPSPCSRELPAVQDASVVAFCGVLQNPAAETLLSGTLALRLPGEPEPFRTSFRLTTPPNPCTKVFVGGVLTFDVGRNPGPPDVGAEFVTSAGRLVGRNPGPPEAPGALVSSNPGPPDNPACIVSIVTEAAR